jgi:hypothetical protein
MANSQAAADSPRPSPSLRLLVDLGSFARTVVLGLLELDGDRRIGSQGLPRPPTGTRGNLELNMFGTMTVWLKIILLGPRL